MRKRSSYRPRSVLQNPVAWVIEGMTPVASQRNFLVSLKIKNHQSMTALTQGMATRFDIDTLIAALNMMEALYRLGFGREYEDVVRTGMTALRDVKERGAANNRFILFAREMSALNLAMELHDAQLDLCTLRDLDKAIAIVRKEQAGRRSIEPHKVE